MDWFQLLAALNMGVQIPLQISAFSSFGYIHRGGISGSYGHSTFNILRTLLVFSIAAMPCYRPTNSAQAFQFLHILFNPHQTCSTYKYQFSIRGKAESPVQVLLNLTRGFLFSNFHIITKLIELFCSELQAVQDIRDSTRLSDFKYEKRA